MVSGHVQGFYCVLFLLLTDDVVVAISNSGTVKVWTLTGGESKVGCSLLPGFFTGTFRNFFLIFSLVIVPNTVWIFVSKTFRGFCVFF